MVRCRKDKMMKDKYKCPDCGVVITGPGYPKLHTCDFRQRCKTLTAEIELRRESEKLFVKRVSTLTADIEYWKKLIKGWKELARDRREYADRLKVEMEKRLETLAIRCGDSAAHQYHTHCHFTCLLCQIEKFRTGEPK
jgi:hypothetical protein